MSGMTGELSSLLGERYRIERELGRGGMATVFLATDTTVGRQVAIKLLHPDLSAAVGAERFHREIRIASTLAHPHILPVHDSGEADGRLFYVMPVVEGESLRELLIRQRQLSLDDAIRITCEVAGALEYAHSRGIVHRDIKPENILLQSGHAIVADFGIARAASSVADAPALTQTGMALGTPTYMSPEQALGEKSIDGRSDQYALACVTYEMLAGEPPFSAPTAQALIARHLTTPVPEISTVRPAVSDELEEVIFRALEKVPADRYPTIADFAQALANADSAPGGTSSRLVAGSRVHRTPRVTRSVRTVRQERRDRSVRRRVAVAAAVILSVALASGGVWWSHARALNARGATELRRIGVLYFKDLSPDGHLTDVADGLSEALIERLRDVQSLEVVSRDGVAPFRTSTLPADSIARTLKVGTIITGTVEQDGDAVRVAMRLRDASGADFERMSFTVSQAALLSARDSVARVTSEMLRPVIGEEVKLRDERHATHDAMAWSLVQRAERLRREQSDRGGASTIGTTALAAADSLAALAETRDPTWSDPAVLRGRIALLAAKQSADAAGATPWLDAGMRAAERALTIDPRSADALEVRGTLRYERYIRNLAANPADERALLQGAEADLLRATELNPAQANAWNVLSALDYRKPDVEMANIHARRALEADAYLAAADEVLWRLFATSYDVGHHDDAVKWCSEGHRRFPAVPRFTLCRLYIGLMERDHPDVADAWRAAAEYVQLSQPARRPLADVQARLLASIPLSYAGLKDSAARVIDAARAMDIADPDGARVAPEALALDRLGKRDEAVHVLKTFLAAHPQHLQGLTRNTWWWKDLENDPEFKALAGRHR